LLNELDWSNGVQESCQAKYADLIDELCQKVVQDGNGSLKACGADPRQAEADLLRLGELIVSRKPEEVKEVKEMHPALLKAAPPAKGEPSIFAYRLRRFVWGPFQAPGVA